MTTRDARARVRTRLEVVLAALDMLDDDESDKGARLTIEEHIDARQGTLALPLDTSYNLFKRE